MFNPKYRISITSKSFPLDNFICLGSQLVAIINFIENFLPPHVWYGADIEAVGKGVGKYNLKGIQLREIGDTPKMIEYCNIVDQFIWGDFVCIDSRYTSENIQNIEIETEDEEFRSIDWKGVLLEIRTFDTTYFEIYSEDLKLIKMMANAYDVKIDYTQK